MSGHNGSGGSGTDEHDEAAEIAALHRRITALGPAHDIESGLRRLMREQPVLAMAGALAVGMIVGRLIRRV
jgi:hypothetical protein